jgi:hypothetical protein
MSVKSKVALTQRVRPLVKKWRSYDNSLDGIAPTQTEIDAIVAALDEASEAADHLIASLERYGETLAERGREIRTATAIMEESNRFALARQTADETTK